MIHGTPLRPSPTAQIPAQGPNVRYVLLHDTMGVYLGNCLGLGFWSLLDPVDQPAAVTFASEFEAREHMATWDRLPAGPALRCIPVVADEGEYASMQSCMAAGLPGWLDTHTTTTNTIPA